MEITANPRFTEYDPTYLQRCLELFDANCPDSFAVNERDDYVEFLNSSPAGYELCWTNKQIVGAYGLNYDQAGIGVIHWILIKPFVQGAGIGKSMMLRGIARAHSLKLDQLNIAASHLSEPFFEKFGAKTIRCIDHGWGENMHRRDMVLALSNNKD